MTAFYANFKVSLRRVGGVTKARVSQVDWGGGGKGQKLFAVSPIEWNRVLHGALFTSKIGLSRPQLSQVEADCIWGYSFGIRGSKNTVIVNAVTF